MEGFRIVGGEKLEGEIRVDAAKNATLPILAAALLPEGETTILHCPDIRDVHILCDILKSLGCACTWKDDALHIRNDELHQWEMPDALSKKIRSSIFLLGPILGKMRRATVTYPGGCEIGLRPIDLHLKGLRALGVKIMDAGGILYCDGRTMQAGDVYFDYPSVGATENVMMAAALLKGVTTIHNAAREPEIEDLQQFLCRMGGRVTGAGTQVIRIEGVEKLHGVAYTPIPDRIAAGTFLCAAAATGGTIRVRNVCPRHLVAVDDKLREMGCRVEEDENSVFLEAPYRLCAFSRLQTQPHPGFPTDMQSQMLAISSTALGTSVIEENVFENRFGPVADLTRMGADIRVSGRLAVVRGVDMLHGMRVTARDLRGGAALVIAALKAQGESIVEDVALIDRGYAHLETSLKRLGARIERITE